jgi:hypothetical protein
MILQEISKKTLILSLILLILILFIYFYSVKQENLDNINNESTIDLKQPTSTLTPITIRNDVPIEANISDQGDELGVITVVGRRSPPLPPPSPPLPPPSPPPPTYVRENPLVKCIPKEILVNASNNIDKLYKPERNYNNPLDIYAGFLLNYNNYDIIKKQINLFKTLTDEQIICFLDTSEPNFCEKVNEFMSHREFKEFEKNIKTPHQILSLYQNEILDIKNFILPKFLTVINKCNTLTKENKIKLLNMLKHMLYTIEYVSYLLGNNWDLIKKVENTINSLK